MATIKFKQTLPVIRLEGTPFYVDVAEQEFREMNNPLNKIPMRGIIIEAEESNCLIYDTQTKNVYDQILDPENVPEHVKLIVIPPLTQLRSMEENKREEQAGKIYPLNHRGIRRSLKGRRGAGI